jgi:T6SS immunity protein Tdi1, C-terminal
VEFDDLLAPVAGEAGIEDALASWSWLLINPVKPLVATAFGDVFVLEQSQEVWFLDIIGGAFERVTASSEDWEKRLHDPEFLDRHFVPSLVTALREAGHTLAQGECYVPKQEPVLGGSWSVENWSPGRWVSRLERQGRVHFAIKDLPDGAVITKWNYTEL